MENRLKEIENSKNDSSRMFRVINEIQRQKPKMPLLIKTKTGGFTINEKEQAEIIAAHFKKQFSKNTQVLNKIHSQPTAMNQPFTAEEIKSTIRSLRNNRSAGDDQIKAEMLKPAPDIHHELLADIYNNISETGEYPPELSLGIITPLQKPGKPKGPIQNLRPITLLSIRRQIPWSQVVTRRELSRLGHLFRLSDDTPAKIAVQYSLRQTKKPRGRQQTTWISMMKIKLLDMGLEWEAANRLAEDRLAWNNFMKLVWPMGFLHANLVRTIN